MPPDRPFLGEPMSKPKPQIIRIEHFGHEFINNENARLLVTGIYHHWILMLV
jgi:hypothetical protein